jgi:hypothetical protein
VLPAFTPSVRLLIAVAAAVVIGVLVWVALQLAGGGEPGISIATSTPPAIATAATVPEAPGAAATVPPGTSATVPDFRGLDRDAAVALSELLQLVPRLVEQSDTAPVGRVIDQSPLPGELVQQRDVVTLFVSTGPAN